MIRFSTSVWKTLILLGVTLSNFWIWKITRENLLLAILLIILSGLLFKLIIEQSFKMWIFTLILVLFFVASLILLKTNFDKTLKMLNPEEKVQLNERHYYYSQELGKLFLNSKVLNYYKNYSLSVYKFEGNLFSNLDLNLYFFASHPRERVGVNEFEKYTPILLPFFIIGVILLIYKGSVWAVGYLVAVALVSAFIDPKYLLGPILFFPLINVGISLGIIYFPTIIKKSK